jgi:hypothetical protein
MDKNKLTVLREVGYAFPKTCARCKHASFVLGVTMKTSSATSNSTGFGAEPRVKATFPMWGVCRKHTYEHEKHTENPRQLSIHLLGSCRFFETGMTPGGPVPIIEQLGGFAEFVHDEQLELRSKRDNPIVFCSVLGALPVLTVELCAKWYGFVLVRDGSPPIVEEVPFPNDDDVRELVKKGLLSRGLVPYVDHVPNPRVVELFAEMRGYYLDEVAYEMMIGRWETERGD